MFEQKQGMGLAKAPLFCYIARKGELHMHETNAELLNSIIKHENFKVVYNQKLNRYELRSSLSTD